MTFAGVPNSFVNGTTADAPSVNANFDAVTTGLNNIDAGQITTGTLPIARGGTGAVTAAVALSNLLSGSTVPIANGGTAAAVRGAFVVSAPGDPVGTSSGSFTMCGLAVAFTPLTSGRVQFNVSGEAVNTTASASITTGVRYGTGVAPVNGAASTGTGVGNLRVITESNGTTVYYPFSITTGASGLTPSTAYWLDLAQAISAGAGAVRNLNITIIEATV